MGGRGRRGPYGGEEVMEENKFPFTEQSGRQSKTMARPSSRAMMTAISNLSHPGTILRA